MKRWEEMTWFTLAPNTGTTKFIATLVLPLEAPAHHTFLAPSPLFTLMIFYQMCSDCKDKLLAHEVNLCSIRHPFLVDRERLE